MVRAFLQGGEEGGGEKGRLAAVEAGHASLAAGVVAGDDTSEKEHEDGKNAEVAKVGDEHH